MARRSDACAIPTTFAWCGPCPSCGQRPGGGRPVQSPVGQQRQQATEHPLGDPQGGIFCAQSGTCVPLADTRAITCRYPQRGLYGRWHIAVASHRAPASMAQWADRGRERLLGTTQATGSATWDHTYLLYVLVFIPVHWQYGLYPVAAISRMCRHGGAGLWSASVRPAHVGKTGPCRGTQRWPVLAGGRRRE